MRNQFYVDSHGVAHTVHSQVALADNLAIEGGYK